MNAKEEAVWDDCVELYGHSIHKLNKTLVRYSSCTDSDKQTWLSSALTYLEDCKNCFIDFDVIDNVLSLIEIDASKLISNALAVTKVEKPQDQTSKDGFPTWVSTSDRKLLQSKSKSTMAHLFAVNAAAKLKKGSGRSVIHVKKGVIGSALTHIMLVGDGLKHNYQR
ncbi:hypothetical protein NE237_011425 [Protea cynaroides]|uniref:Pectinesterase inhibitor domain-containing protein n=1 Tax=Protea cynaroides TaxID=273540 RepID=A0A9Q0GZ35_9MAGN|nr:hypothetical protein NE237_011425 [Protea cynaroides]